MPVAARKLYDAILYIARALNLFYGLNTALKKDFPGFSYYTATTPHS